LKSRATRVQLTTNGHKPDLEAVEGAFGANIDYAMLIKMYEGDSGKRATASTSYAERANLTSKKLDTHKAAIALYAMWYNVARMHQPLRVTPAMEAGISDHVWSAEEIARLAE
jgi:hypothetical protein